MNKLQIKLGELKSMLIDDDYNDSNIVMQTLLEIEKEAINYSQCSTQLKDKKTPTFTEWLKMYNYKKVKTMFVAHGKEYYYTEVYKQYQDWLKGF